jgi:hypothetical protein
MVTKAPANIASIPISEVNDVAGASIRADGGVTMERSTLNMTNSWHTAIRFRVAHD